MQGDRIEALERDLAAARDALSTSESANCEERGEWSRLYAVLTEGRAGTTYSLDDLRKVVAEATRSVAR